jgi:hypothetical protein
MCQEQKYATQRSDVVACSLVSRVLTQMHVQMQRILLGKLPQTLNSYLNTAVTFVKIDYIPIFISYDLHFKIKTTCYSQRKQVSS